MAELTPWFASRALRILSGIGSGSNGHSLISGSVVNAPSPIPRYQSNTSPYGIYTMNYLEFGLVSVVTQPDCQVMWDEMVTILKEI